MRQALVLTVLLLPACADAPPPPEPPKPIQTTPQTEESIEGSDLAAPGS